MIILRRPWTSQPQIRAPINSGLRGVKCVWVGSSYERTYANNEATSTLAGAPTRATTAAGVATTYLAGTSSRLQIAANSNMLFGNSATIAMFRRHADTTLRAATSFGYSTSTSDRVQAHLPYSDGTAYFDFGNSTAGSGRGSGSWGTKSTTWEAVICVAGPSKGREIWRAGRRIVSNTGATAARPSNSSAFAIGTISGISTDAEEVALFVISDVEWTDAEIIAWSARPYAQTFAPLRKIVPVEAPIGGASVPSITAVYADSVGTDRATPRVTLDYA